MSGVQGPLETRPKTTFESVAALQSFDATPFDSGEVVCVRNGSPQNPDFGFLSLYILSRESAVPVSVPTVLAVAPIPSTGRWHQIA